MDFRVVFDPKAWLLGFDRTEVRLQPFLIDGQPKLKVRTLFALYLVPMVRLSWQGAERLVDAPRGDRREDRRLGDGFRRGFDVPGDREQQKGLTRRCDANELKLARQS